MDTPMPPSTSSDYAGLKEELQKIAGIIEQYPDNLKQRAFELLIEAYHNSNRARNGAAEATPESSEPASAPVEEPVADVAEIPVEPAAEEPAVESFPVEAAAVEPGESVGEVEIPVSQEASNGAHLEPDSRISAKLQDSTNMLRRRIRLRTMSQMPWRSPN